MQERRRYVRLNVPLEVSYTIEGRSDPSRKSISKNISPSGIRFVMGEELPKGVILQLNIKIPSKTEPIPLKARVVWTKKEVREGKEVYDSGFEIVDIDEGCKSEFFQYLCTLMYDQLKKIG